MRDRYDWIHGRLDTERGELAPLSEIEAEELRPYLDAVALLESSAEGAPDGFTAGVLAALPDRPEPCWLSALAARWRLDWRWVGPALAGALASAVLAIGLVETRVAADRELVAVTFELHAPGAHQVELVGSFTEWQSDGIPLQGPDGAGHWTATVKLPSGTHEYLFRVDGSQWQTDPRATAYRPDGFGLENAVLQI